ncbi:MAG: cytochrome c biogenesis protein CcsA [Ardenticatenia bacterium]|nr:cytochrome c biogenesis protein CcsA [Ardenticatenia bacterium]
MTSATWRRTERGLGWLALLLSAMTLVAGLWFSPSERVLGRMVGILYVHAGAAWTTYLAGGVTAIAALAYLRSRSEAWDGLAVAGGEAGLWLGTVTLLTGSLWARGAQGWWWRWDDPRLVLTLFLWFLYAGYLTLRQFTEGERRARLSAVLALLGLPVMVLNHFALTLWQPRFHPAPVIGRPGGPAASPQFLWLLGLSMLAYTVLLAWMLLGRARLESLRNALEA